MQARRSRHCSKRGSTWIIGSYADTMSAAEDEERNFVAVVNFISMRMQLNVDTWGHVSAYEVNS